LFATERNRQVDKYYSKDDEPLSAGQDSFQQVWEVDGCYANPPWSLLERTVRRIREERLKVVLISPYWPSANWFKMAVKMAACAPIVLGRHAKLYLMHDGKNLGPARWSSVAWLLDGAVEGVANWEVGKPASIIDWSVSDEPKLLSPEDISEIPKLHNVDYNKRHKHSIEPVVNQRLAKTTFRDLQEQDKDLKKAFEEVEDTSIPDDKRSFAIKDGRLCKIIKEEIVPGVVKPTLRLVVPRQIHKSVIYACHNDVITGHLGYKRTLLRVQQRYWWPRMTKDVRWYIRSCRDCQFAKKDTGPKGGPLNPLPPCTEPFEVIGMDLVMPMPRSKHGNVAILVWQDYATRWCDAIPLKDTTASTLGRAFWFNIVCRFGCPRRILTDLGRNFMSAMFDEILRFTKTSRLRTTAYHPQTDGLVERQNQTMKQMIRTYINRKQDDWDELLPYLAFAYNTSANSTTGYSPYYLLYGREATLPVDVAMDWTPESQLTHGIHEKLQIARRLAQENLIDAQNNQRRNYDVKRGEAEKFKIGDVVLVRVEFVSKGKKKSISPRYLKMGRIVSISPGNVYKIQLGLKKYSWINMERLKRFYPSEYDRRNMEPWLITPLMDIAEEVTKEQLEDDDNEGEDVDVNDEGDDDDGDEKEVDSSADAERDFRIPEGE
jgi:hypothetical protein